MFRNFLKTTLRSLRRNYIYTTINILGMAIGISGTILTYVLFDYEAKFDHFLTNTGNIYRVNEHRLVEGKEQPWGITPMALGPELSVANENIDNYCRYGTSQVLIKYEDIVHTENMFFADSNFFDLFNFKILQGDIGSFHRKNIAVVSREFAQKYFGQGEAPGKQISVVRDDKVTLDLVIGAVLDKVPKNSSFQFGIIIPYDNVYSMYRIERTAWGMEVPTITYVQLSPSTDPGQIATLLKTYVLKNNEILDDWQVKDYYLMPFKDQKKESHSLYSAITWPGAPVSALYGSLLLNTIILLISCFNFTNTAMAFARKRLKEIGLRKTFGAEKRQIVVQFMFENLLQCFAGLLIAMYIADAWVSWMNVQWPLELTTNYFGNPLLIAYLIIILFVASLIGGAYPSFYVARYQPVNILKGDLKFSGTNIFTRILLTIQFGFSVMAVFCAVVLYLNARYQLNLDWGYNKKSVIVVPMHDEGNLEVYKNAARNIPGIIEVAGTVHNASFGHDNALVDINGEPHQAHVLMTGDRYIKTLGMEIVEGRDFIPESDNDRNEAIIVNLKFLESFGIKTPLSQLIRMEGHSYYIVGVVRDFMPYGLMSPVNPVIIRSVPDSKCTQLCISAEPVRLTEVYGSLQKKWKELFPMKPFDGYYQEEASGYAIQTNQGILTQFTFMGLFALVLSTIGLYSMVALNVTKRTKEIGIRKVLGASTGQIINLVNREFIIILAIACLYGCVTGYYFMNKFLGDIFTYYLNIGSGAFIISVSLILLTAFITSGRKIYVAAQTDPARSLRYE